MIRSCDRCDALEEDGDCILVTIHIHAMAPIPKILCAQCREAFKWWMGQTSVGGIMVPRGEMR